MSMQRFMTTMPGREVRAARAADSQAAPAPTTRTQVRLSVTTQPCLTIATRLSFAAASALAADI